MSKLPPNPALKDLAPLLGKWNVEAPQFPGQRGRAIFEWLEDGAYLRFHTDPPDPAPAATLIISRDESADVYTVLHYDARGVSRVYEMSFTGRVWRIWRQAPGFWQRFAGAPQRRRPVDLGHVGEVGRRGELGARFRPDLQQGQVAAAPGGRA